MSQATELIAKQMAAGASIGRIWGTLVYNVKDTAYNAKGDGVIDDTLAITNTINAASVNGGTVVFPPGTYVTGNFTVPSNVTLWFMNGAKLSINSGATVTINGPIDAGLYQIFSGSGTISGNMKVGEIYPQWWGAKGDGATDDTTSINKAISDLQTASNEPVIVFPAGDYVIKSSIIIKQGGGGAKHSINIQAYGARLLAGAPGLNLIKIVSFGDPASYQNIGITRVFGLRLYGDNSSGSGGISIGKRTTAATDYGVTGIYPSVFKDCVIENVQYGVVVSDSRMIEFDNVSMSLSMNPCYGFYIQSIYDKFTGDSWIKHCNIDAGANGTAIYLTATTVSTGSTLNGLHIENCVLYGQTGIDVQVTNASASIKDLFIEGTAMDLRGTGNGISLNGFAVRSIEQVFITDCWINSCIQGLIATLCTGVTMTSGKISSCTLPSVDLENTNDCKVIGVTMYDVNKNGNGGGVIKLGGSGNRNKIIDCNVYFTGTYTNQIITIASTQTKPIVTRNQTDGTTAGFISNGVAGTEGTNFIVAGNL